MKCCCPGHHQHALLTCLLTSAERRKHGELIVHDRPKASCDQCVCGCDLTCVCLQLLQRSVAPLMDEWMDGWTDGELPSHLMEMMAAHMHCNCHLWLDPQLTALFAWGPPGQMDAGSSCGRLAMAGVVVLP